MSVFLWFHRPTLQNFVLRVAFATHQGGTTLHLKLKKEKEKNSIKMKLGNIKHILLQLKIFDTSNFPPLSGFSIQNIKALCEILEKNNIYFDDDDFISLLYSKE